MAGARTQPDEDVRRGFLAHFRILPLTAQIAEEAVKLRQHCRLAEALGERPLAQTYSSAQLASMNIVLLDTGPLVALLDRSGAELYAAYNSDTGSARFYILSLPKEPPIQIAAGTVKPFAARHLPPGGFLIYCASPRCSPPAPFAGFLRAPGLQSAVPKQADWKSPLFEKQFRELRSNFPGELCDSVFRFKEPWIAPAFARLRVGRRITRMSAGMTKSERRINT